MSRLGSEVLAQAPLLSPEEVVEHVEAVTVDDLRELVESLWPPERLSFAGIGPDEAPFDKARRRCPRRAQPHDPCRRHRCRGRMGEAVCVAVGDAPDMELVARVDPSLGTDLADALAGQPDVLVDFTIPSTAVANSEAGRECRSPRRHRDTGFDVAELRDCTGANVFIAPNFAIGAVLMMEFAARRPATWRAPRSSNCTMTASLTRRAARLR